MTYALKCWPKYFEAVAAGKKTFEIRKISPTFGIPEVGDSLKLDEFNPDCCVIPGYTGRSVWVNISYVCDLEVVLPGCIGMSIQVMTLEGFK